MSLLTISSNTLLNIANAIRAKTGKTAKMTPVEMETEIASISGIKRLSWNQCPVAVRNFINAVQANPYNGNDYSYSYIANYAPSEPNNTNTKPLAYTIDGKSYANNVPKVATPFSTDFSAGTLTALDSIRWFNTYTANCRDLGGWACNGGTVKYSTLIRGALPNKNNIEFDKKLMVDVVGVKSELQLYGNPDDQYDFEWGASPWGIDWYGYNDFIWYNITKTDVWRYVLDTVFNSVAHSKPVYFHCGAGKDRTGTVAVMLLALLGVSQSDIDIDFELTTFATGSGTGITSRTGSDYKNYISAIKNYPLAKGLDDTFENHAFSFVLSLGFTANEINNFRVNCINGNPAIITPGEPTNIFNPGSTDNQTPKYRFNSSNKIVTSPASTNVVVTMLMQVNPGDAVSVETDTAPSVEDMSNTYSYCAVFYKNESPVTRISAWGNGIREASTTWNFVCPDGDFNGVRIAIPYTDINNVKVIV